MSTKILCVPMLLLCMTLNLWAGGGSQARPTGSQVQTVYQRDPNLNPPGVFPINKTKVPLKIGIGQLAVVEDWKTNWMTVQMEKNGNYDLTFEVYPAGEIAQKFELMVMAGGADLPDVMMASLSVPTATKYGEAGMIIPLDNYYKNSTYFIKEALPELAVDALRYITSYDGHIYGLFNIKEDMNNEFSGARIMMYKPWLDKLGLSMPQNINEFLNVLRAFRDNDPNGNGQRDEIPLIAHKNTISANYLRAMMTPFIYTQENYWILNNGKIDVAFNKPQWREGLRYTKQLIDEGLLSPLSFTQDQTQLFGLISPDPARVGSFVEISSSRLGNNIKQWEYYVVPALEGPGGRQQVWNPTLPQIAMVITKNCKTPEAAFMLGDYMSSPEMSIATRWGEKGVDWREPGPNDEVVLVYQQLGYTPNYRAISQWNVVQNKWWAQTGPHIINYKWQHGGTTGPFEERQIYDGGTRLAEGVADALKYVNRNPIVGLIYTEEEQEVINESHQAILTYVNESFARFVMGDLSIDRDWDNYVAEFNRMHLADVIKVTQSCWDRINK